MRTSVLFFFVFLLPAMAEAKEKEITTKITAVTVYESGAQVTREGAVHLQEGPQILVFTDFPKTVDLSRIKFSAEGDITVLTTFRDQKIDTISGAEHEELRRILQAEWTQLQAEIQRENGWLSVYDREEQLLQNNTIFHSKDEGIEVETLKEAASFIRERYIDIRNNRLAIHDRIARINERIAVINQELAQLGGVVVQSELLYKVRINVDKAGVANFRLSYQVGSAGWYTGYDANFSSVNEPLMLCHNAFVYQSTGEDWSKVDLTLTTGTPRFSKTKPNLTPWYVGSVPTQFHGYGQADLNMMLRSSAFNSAIRQVSGQVTDQYGQPLAGVTVNVPGTSVGAMSDIHGNYMISIPAGYASLTFNQIGFRQESLPVSATSMNVKLAENVALLEQVTVLSASTKRSEDVKRTPLRNRDGAAEMNFAAVATNYTPTQTEFNIELPYDIPSDGVRYAVKISDIQVDADFIYQCAPKLDPAVYLTAQITDWEDYGLFPGAMNIYFDKNYVGQTQLILQNTQDTLSLSLGADKAIEVRRMRSKTDSKRQVIGGTRKEVREFAIYVRNNKREEVHIQVEDQAPVASTEDVSVNVNNLDGGRIQEDTGMVVWDLKLQSGKDKKLTFRYTVQYPKDLMINL